MHSPVEHLAERKSDLILPIVAFPDVFVHNGVFFSFRLLGQ